MAAPINIIERSGWFMNDHSPAEGNQNLVNANKMCRVVFWGDKFKLYQRNSALGNFIGPIIQTALTNEYTRTSWSSMLTAMVVTTLLTLPYEIAFKKSTNPSLTAEDKTSALKCYAALALSSGVETAIMLGIAKLAENFFSIPSTVTYFGLGFMNLAYPQIASVSIKGYLAFWPNLKRQERTMGA